MKPSMWSGGSARQGLVGVGIEALPYEAWLASI